MSQPPMKDITSKQQNQTKDKKYDLASTDRFWSQHKVRLVGET